MKKLGPMLAFDWGDGWTVLKTDRLFVVNPSILSWVRKSARKNHVCATQLKNGKTALKDECHSQASETHDNFGDDLVKTAKNGHKVNAD